MLSQKLPTINSELAKRLMEDPKKKVSHKEKREEREKIVLQVADVSNPLGDSRFSAMFSNPNFQIDEESEVGNMHYIMSWHFNVL